MPAGVLKESAPPRIRHCVRTSLGNSARGPPRGCWLLRRSSEGSGTPAKALPSCPPDPMGTSLGLRRDDPSGVSAADGRRRDVDSARAGSPIRSPRGCRSGRCLNESASRRALPPSAVLTWSRRPSTRGETIPRARPQLRAHGRRRHVDPARPRQPFSATRRMLVTRPAQDRIRPRKGTASVRRADPVATSLDPRRDDPLGPCPVPCRRPPQAR
jgi:hypothetical protein